MRAIIVTREAKGRSGYTDLFLKLRSVLRAAETRMRAIKKTISSISGGDKLDTGLHFAL